MMIYMRWNLHIKKIMQMPVKHLLESGKGLFIQKDGCVLALRDNMQVDIGNEAFVRHTKAAVEYRGMDYYRRRYTLNSGVNN